MARATGYLALTALAMLTLIGARIEATAAGEEMSLEDLLYWGEMLASDCATCHVLGANPGARQVGIPTISGIPRGELFKTIGACITNPRNMAFTDYGSDLRRRERSGQVSAGHGVTMTGEEVNALMTYLESLPRR